MVPCQSAQKEDKNEEEKRTDILNKEMESSKHFEYALREENRLLFNMMISDCGKNQD
jgi:hypothetical protein